MLGNDYFFYGLIRKYVTIFGSMFNNIVIDRNDSAGNVTQIINIPLAYSAKDKMLSRLMQDPNISRQDATILPRMSFEIIDIKYDSSRKMNTVGTQSTGLTSNSVSQVYNPVPYNIDFDLYIYTKTNADVTKIVEQILPFFTPSFSVSAFLVPGYPSISIPIVLNNIVISDNNPEDLNARRVQIWTLRFTLQGYLYGPSTTKPVINMTNVAVAGANNSVININADDPIYNYGLDDLQTGDLFVSNKLGPEL